MTKERPQKMTALRQGRHAKPVSDEGVDVCEMLVAELQARRARPFRRRSACIDCCRAHSGGAYDDRFRFTKLVPSAGEAGRGQ